MRTQKAEERCGKNDLGYLNSTYFHEMSYPFGLGHLSLEKITQSIVITALVSLELMECPYNPSPVLGNMSNIR